MDYIAKSVFLELRELGKGQSNFHMVFLWLAASPPFSRSLTLTLSPTIISNFDAGPMGQPVLFNPFALRTVVHPSRPVFRDDNELQIFVPVFSTAIWFSIT